VQTLVSRLDSISRTDATSFQYNTAIEQITKQEQGEASNMLDVFCECYTLENRPYIWGWISVCIIIGEIILGLVIIPIVFMRE
jgi:hypothetical protein